MASSRSNPTRYPGVVVRGQKLTCRPVERRVVPVAQPAVEPAGHLRRESAEAWAALLRDLKRRGLEARLLMIGDGNLGLWKSLRQVWPETREQRCWVHKLINVLDKLPKRVQGRAKALLHEIIQAPSRAEAEAASEWFGEEFGAKYSKALASLEEGGEELLTFFDFPAEHWTHLRTTNPIESVFGTTGHRRKKTRGHGSRRAALGMAFSCSSPRRSAGGG